MAYTTINKSTEHFNTVTYTGNGNAGHSITGVGFQPDWTWVKNRSDTYGHNLVNSVTNTLMFSNANAPEEAIGNTVTSFDSDGFTVGTSAGVNFPPDDIVSWNWLGSNTTAANTDGSINSTVSANTTSGFSIVSWNGNSGTIGHGLGVKPAMIIVKSRQTANNWVVMHKDLTGGMDTNILVLNSTGAEGGGGAGMAEPTSSVFTITGGLAANDNNIGYVFAEKQGYSKFGSYTGNGNADGTFVYTGFKPAFFLVKRTDSTPSWTLLDNKRDPFNVTTERLFPNENAAGSVGVNANTDFLSNGVKIRVNHNNFNTSGGTYIYMAFAEAPLVGTNNVPATAR